MRRVPRCSKDPQHGEMTPTGVQTLRVEQQKRVVTVQYQCLVCGRRQSEEVREDLLLEAERQVWLSRR